MSSIDDAPDGARSPHAPRAAYCPRALGAGGGATPPVAVAVAVAAAAALLLLLLAPPLRAGAHGGAAPILFGGAAPAPSGYDAALAALDARRAPIDFGLDDAVAALRAASFPVLNESVPSALVVLREVLRNQAPFLRLAGRDTGFWLTGSAALHARVAAAAAQFGRACLRADVTLVGVAVASLEARFLQEWAAWHLFVAGFTHLVVYNNVGAGVGGDNTPQVLQPFVDAGVVTVRPWAPRAQYLPGARDTQGAAHHECAARLRAVSCRYARGSPFDTSLAPCTEEEIAGAQAATGRATWLAALDVDEFLVLREPGACATDALRPLRGEAGLAVPRRVFGHSGHFMAPRGQLVTEAYTQRLPDDPLNARVKTIANVRFLLDFEGPHMARYAGGRTAVDEFGAPVAGPTVPSPPAEARQTIFVHHYLPRSVEDGVLRWVHARPSVRGDAHHLDVRDPAQLAALYRAGCDARRLTDETALAGAAMVRAILQPPAPLLVAPREAAGFTFSLWGGSRLQQRQQSSRPVGDGCGRRAGSGGRLGDDSES